MIGVFYTKAKSTNGESMYKKFFKRLFDIIFSLLGIIFLALPMLIIVIIIRIDSKGRAVFSQTRVGLHKKPFKIYKFRTMYIETPENIPTRDLEDPNKWMTKFGKFLRRTSIDEFPQLFNILKGEMSFVGPRPVILVERDLVDAREVYGANDVLPGLTGLSQISGRDEISIEEKAQIDGEYADRLKNGHFDGFVTDIICLFKTVACVFKGEGIAGIEPRKKKNKQNDKTNV